MLTNQAMHLVISFEQVDSLATVTWQPHTLRPVLRSCLVLVDGDEAVRGPNGVPESTTVIVILWTVSCVPPETIPGSG
jgi:hypothetical protein